MSHDEYRGEPIPGLPERPPEDETLIWQGAPLWRSLAIRAFHVRKIAIYFGVIWLALAIRDLLAGHYLSILKAAFWLSLPALAAIAVLSALAWLYARMTVYSITSRRVVIRSGIALPMSVNVPFAKVESANCRMFRDGTADLPIRVLRGQNTSFVILWPNVRPWRFARPEPMLRCVDDGQRVAHILAQALVDYAEPDTGMPRIEAPGTATPDASSDAGRHSSQHAALA